MVTCEHLVTGVMYSLTGKIVFMCCLCFICSSEKHFLHYMFTVLTRSDSLPEFSAVCVYDDRRIKHFSNEERVWILTDKDWTEAPEEPADPIDWYRHQIRTLSNCTDSLCSDHVLQRIIGCELEKLPEGSVNLTVFDDYGFDGEDLISFNYDTMKWIDKNPKAKRTKVEWDRHTGRNQFLKHFLKNCTDWISTYTNRKKMGNRAVCEAESQRPGIKVLSAVAAVVLLALIGYWIYLKQWSDGKMSSYVDKSGKEIKRTDYIRPH